MNRIEKAIEWLSNWEQHKEARAIERLLAEYNQMKAKLEKAGK